MPQDIQTTTHGGILEIGLTRPERKNAITGEMYLALAAAFTQAEADPAIRVILILGSESIFTAGNDLADFQANPPKGTAAPVFIFMQAMLDCTKVIIAGVAGPAVGIGTTLLLHCDLVVAGTSATFLLPFVQLGLVPEFASSHLLPKVLGRQRAARHFLLGDPLDAPTALACGMVSQVVADSEVADLSRNYAQRLTKMPPQALAQARALLAPDREDMAAIIAKEAAIFSAALTGPEFGEAARAFFEKRAPRFS